MIYNGPDDVKREWLAHATAAAERAKNDTISDLVTELRTRMAELVTEKEEWLLRAHAAERELRRYRERETP